MEQTKKIENKEKRFLSDDFLPMNVCRLQRFFGTRRHASQSIIIFVRLLSIKLFDLISICSKIDLLLVWLKFEFQSVLPRIMGNTDKTKLIII